MPDPLCAERGPNASLRALAISQKPSGASRTTRAGGSLVTEAPGAKDLVRGGDARHATAGATVRREGVSGDASLCAAALALVKDLVAAEFRHLPGSAGGARRGDRSEAEKMMPFCPATIRRRLSRSCMTNGGAWQARTLEASAGCCMRRASASAQGSCGSRFCCRRRARRGFSPDSPMWLCVSMIDPRRAREGMRILDDVLSESLCHISGPDRGRIEVIAEFRNLAS